MRRRTSGKRARKASTRSASPYQPARRRTSRSSPCPPRSSRISPTDARAWSAAREHPLGVGPQRAARLRRLQAAARAHEQRHAELLLQPPHLLGERRLGQVERVRRRAERAVPGGAEEVPSCWRVIGSAYRSCRQPVLKAMAFYAGWMHDIHPHPRRGGHRSSRRSGRRTVAESDASAPVPASPPEPMSHGANAKGSSSCCSRRPASAPWPCSPSWPTAPGPA